MAHFKRKTSRSQQSGHYSSNAIKHRRGKNYTGWEWLNHKPRWFDKLFHIRPERSERRRKEKLILSGSDPDGMVWPGDKRRVVYYW